MKGGGVPNWVACSVDTSHPPQTSKKYPNLKKIPITTYPNSSGGPLNTLKRVYNIYVN
jgi:hypothetical protein